MELDLSGLFALVDRHHGKNIETMSATPDWDKDIKARHIPEYYRETYIKLRERQYDEKITGSRLRDTLLKMLVDDPELMEQTLKDTAIQAAIAEGIRKEKSDLQEARSKLHRAENEAFNSLSKARNVQDEAERMLRKAEHERDKVEAEKQELWDAIGDMETAEMRDRFRAYMAYKLDFENNLKSPQNNSMFIAGAAALLTGSPIAINKENKDND